MSGRGALSPEQIDAQKVIDGRYRVEGEIARGSMGAVFAVVDLSTGRRIALKRQLGAREALIRMFEREYHTLVGLKHPRIIEVYDYGIDAEGPYYTMELLDGSDLRERAPMDYREACRYLRDVASSLGLLHARRLLHRDLSPRNVRVTSDGRCKLIDFGGLGGFGVPDIVVGTPPFVPPEALHSAALDQRADLFALGALGYWILTGRHAFPARELAALPTAWRNIPPRPSEIAAASPQSERSPIPRELDDLIMSLLTLNPLGRPASAAEVIDRLGMIGGLPPETEQLASQSYLVGVALVGRNRERLRLQKHLTDAISGRGSCIVIEAIPGLGSTSLLAELCVASQLAGALPIVVDGSQNRGPYGVVHSVIDKVIAAAPEDAAAAAAGHVAVLARFSTTMRELLKVAPDATDYSATPGEFRRRVQEALSVWFRNLAARRPLLLGVDEAQRVDDASAALLATLATGASEHALLIIVCHKPGETDSAPTALRALHNAGARMRLRVLSRTDVIDLVGQWFGTVEDATRLAAWLYRLSGGNPRACTELVTHLISKNVIRYILGTWVLPRDLSLLELPTSLDQLLEQRLLALTPDAAKLVQALSVHRGQVPIDQCVALAEGEGIAHPFLALDALTRENVLVNAGNAYVFSDPKLRELLLERLDPKRRRDLHLRMGALIERSGLTDSATLLDAGWHLMHGGDEDGGAKMLAEVGVALSYGADEFPAAVPALRAALQVYRKRDKPAHELLRLLTPLAMAGYYVDRKLADEFGEETLMHFERLLGLKLGTRLRPWLGMRLSFFVGLGSAAARFLLVPGLGGIAGLRATITRYITCISTLTGAATVCLDAVRARAYAARIEPFLALGANHGAALAYRFARLLAMLPEERIIEVIAGCREIIARLEDPRPIADLPTEARRVLLGGALYATGAMEVFREGRGALECAEKLDRSGLKIDEMVADQLRTSYHALRGEVAQAERYRARVEMHAIQAGSGWQVEVWVPSSMIVVYVLTLDAIGLKRTVEQLDHLGEELPTIKQKAADARAEYHHIKGEHELGFALGLAQLDATAPRSWLGRSFSTANHARAYNRLGRHQEAKALVEPLIAGLSEADRSVIAIYSSAFRELAHAYAGLGDHAKAFSIIDDMLERHGPSRHPLLLGNLHATAAAIAVDAGDAVRAIDHVGQMERWFRPTDNPALISQCEHMQRYVFRMANEQALDVDHAAVDPTVEDGSGTVRSLMSQCEGPEKRAEFALQLMLNHVRGQSGFLFAYDKAELKLVAPHHGQEPATEIMARIQADIASHLQDEEATVVTRAPGSTSMPPPMPNAEIKQTYRTFVLTVPGLTEPYVVGAVAVAVDPTARPLRQPLKVFTEAIARSLFEAGDAGSVTETQTATKTTL